MYICKYVNMYICIYVYMYICINVYLYIWKLLINKNVANVKLKKKVMNTSTVVSVVNISRNISTKLRQEERTKETEPPKEV